MIHFPIYTFQKNMPISREHFIEKCKLLLKLYEKCRFFKLKNAMGRTTNHDNEVFRQVKSSWKNPANTW